jgi:hypothetical protein
MDHLPRADRFCEQPTDSPYWNESVWFSFSLPEQHKHGAIQYYFRPNMNMLNGGPFFWDPSGTNTWDCLYYNWSHLQALPEGAQKFDMRALNSLTVQVTEPLQRYRIAYDNEDFKLDLEWTAIGPLHELKGGDASTQAAQKFHIEQPGRMVGTGSRDGQPFTIDCFSMRDTSYGPRSYASMASGGYFWGIAGDRAFHAITKGEGPVQKLIGGFLWLNGETVSLVEGRRTVTEFGRHGPRRVEFEAIDASGRRIAAQGELDEGFIFTGYTDHTVVWALTRWKWDDVELWGDNQEFCSALRFRRIARGDIQLGAG